MMVRALILALDEWGYRCPVEGGFITDDTPFEAAKAIRDLVADRERLATAHTKACDAADLILARVTAEIGRYVAQATDEDMVPMMVETGVEITGKMFRDLYEATDRAALSGSGK